jgi:hypothetical protein
LEARERFDFTIRGKTRSYRESDSFLFKAKYVITHAGARIFLGQNSAEALFDFHSDRHSE